MMREKPPVGEIKLQNFFNATTSDVAGWLYGLVGPLGARQIGAHLTGLADLQAGMSRTDKGKHQAFVDDLNALVKKHGMMLYSGLAYYELQLAPIESDEASAKVSVDDESGCYRLDE